MPMLSMASKRQKRTTLPRRPLPSLPEDLIMSEILTRLPVKPLLRFQCVSKAWHSWISSLAFAESHLHFQENDENKVIEFSLANNSRLQLSLFSIVHKKESSTSLGADRAVKVPEDALRFLGSYNGLLCFRGYDQVIVWNPCTGKQKKVDDAPTCQGFDICGFGYDQQNCDYKVVYACRTRNFVENDLWIYSFKAGGWENIRRGFRAGVVNPNIGVHVSGTLNWCSNKLRAHEGWKWKIVSFNLTTNSATIMSLPEHERSSAVYISQSRGFLLASCLHKGEMSVWQMNEFGVEKSWEKLVSVPNLPKIPNRRGLLSDTYVIISSCVSLLYVSKNADVIMKVGPTLRLYRSKTRRSRTVNESQPPYEGFKAISFLESLVSPPGLSDDEDGEQEQEQQS